MPLYICTPRATTPELASRAQLEWPENLPWFQFTRTVLPQIIKRIQFVRVAARNKRLSAWSDGHRQRPSLSIDRFSQGLERITRATRPETTQAIFTALAQTGLRILIDSEHVTRTLFYDRSIDRIAARLDGFLPESYKEENVHRAAVLAGGSRMEIQTELLKLFLYMASNRLMLQWNPREYELRGRQRQKYMEEAQTVVSLFRLCGLDNLEAIRRLGNISQNSTSMTAMIDTLYEACIHVGAADLVFYLLEADIGIRYSRRVTHASTCVDGARYGRLWVHSPHMSRRSWSGLEAALHQGSLRVCEVLLKAGASQHLKHYAALHRAFDCIFHGPEAVSVDAIRLLIGIEDIRSTILHETTLLGLLCTAVFFGRANIAHATMGLMASLLGGPLVKVERQSLMDHGHKLYHPQVSLVVSALHDVSCLGMCVLFGFSASGGVSGPDTVAFIESALEKQALNPDCIKRPPSDAMILAIARGQMEVVTYLYQAGASLTTCNGLLNPLYAAVHCLQVQSCQFLLETIAPDPLEATEINRIWRKKSNDWRKKSNGWRKRDHTGAPSLLHVAVASAIRSDAHTGACEILQLLLQHGATINAEYPVMAENVPGDFDFLSDSWRRYEDPKKMQVTPLTFTLSYQLWTLASVLLRNGARATAADLALFKEQIECKESCSDDLDDRQLETRVLLKRLLASRTSAANIGIETLDWATAAVQIPPSTDDVAIDIDSSAANYEEISAEQIEYRIIDGCSSRDILLGLNQCFPSYDPAVLCAAVWKLHHEGLSEGDTLLSELIQRRDNALDKVVSAENLTLENTAVALAAYYFKSLDILTQLLPERGSELAKLLTQFPASARIKTRAEPYPATCAFEYNDGQQTEDARAHFQEAHKMCAMARSGKFIDPDSNCRSVFFWREDYQTASPLYLAIKARNLKALGFLLGYGYKVDDSTLITAIQHELPLALVRELSQSYYTNVNGNLGDKISKSSDELYLSWGLPFMGDVLWGCLPLHVAICKGNIDLAICLLNCGADPNSLLPDECVSPLHLAVASGSLQLVHMLLDRGALVDEVSETGSRLGWMSKVTPLQIAAENGSIGILKTLIQHGANVNTGDIDQPTALQRAASKGRVDSVQMLLQSGGQTRGRSRVGYVLAIQRSEDKGFSGVVKVLKSHRQWTSEDEKILEELKVHPVDDESHVLIHPEDYNNIELPIAVTKAAAILMDPNGIRSIGLKWWPGWNIGRLVHRFDFVVANGWIDEWMFDLLTLESIRQYSCDCEPKILLSDQRIVELVARRGRHPRTADSSSSPLRFERQGASPESNQEIHQQCSLISRIGHGSSGCERQRDTDAGSLTAHVPAPTLGNEWNTLSNQFWEWSQCKDRIASSFVLKTGNPRYGRGMKVIVLGITPLGEQELEPTTNTSVRVACNFGWILNPSEPISTVSARVRRTQPGSRSWSSRRPISSENMHDGFATDDEYDADDESSLESEDEESYLRRSSSNDEESLGMVIENRGESAELVHLDEPQENETAAQGTELDMGAFIRSLFEESAGDEYFDFAVEETGQSVEVGMTVRTGERGMNRAVESSGDPSNETRRGIGVDDGEEDEEAARTREVLGDIMGIAEAPFRPMEWLL